MNKIGVLEGLLFVVGDDGLSLSQIRDILCVTEDEAKELLLSLKKRYESCEYGIKIGFLGDKFKLTTKKEHKDFYKMLTENKESNTLSSQALETLAIIAYNAPITVQEVEEIRGVSSREMIRRLMARGFLKETGKSNLPGRPTLYATTSDFLDYFGLSSLDELPKINFEAKDSDDTDLYHSKYKEDGEEIV